MSVCRCVYADEQAAEKDEKVFLISMANVCRTNERAADGGTDVTEIKRPEEESNKIFNVFVADFLARKARKNHKKLSKQKIFKEKNYNNNTKWHLHWSVSLAAAGGQILSARISAAYARGLSAPAMSTALTVYSALKVGDKRKQTSTNVFTRATTRSTILHTADVWLCARTIFRPQWVPAHQFIAYQSGLLSCWCCNPVCCSRCAIERNIDCLIWILL